MLPPPKTPVPPLVPRPPSYSIHTASCGMRARRLSEREPTPRDGFARSGGSSSRDPSPREKRASLSSSTISMRELAIKLPANRAVGVGGKVWVGWRDV